ncbi:hypothetical protein SAMN05216303_105252 [Rhodoferax sp. OV413]|uniref:hypothetical protein n=1 Tax=Rhodoferax sp. OV413 TaxID=1855285 RepID=UPI00088F0446|nr:hypothetical protein [Rhodoferax sp. OV413]SDP59528.1 hypothetical protein SAMN05216303_105252 [Rhodoferax sp. OV413]
MSFLNQLKNQAHALRNQQNAVQHSLEARAAQTEAACQTVAAYLADLAQQLNVIAPPAPALSLDGKTPWPAMKLVDFRCDQRKKRARGVDLVDYIGMGWRITPQDGPPVKGAVSVNFPPDLERVESRLALGHLQHERQEQRHPDTNKLLSIRFEYLTALMGSVRITPDHEQASLAFRISNATGFEVLTTQWAASDTTPAMLDELARLVVGQPNRFIR